jgi:DNA-binding NtrC family response regulator
MEKKGRILLVDDDEGVLFTTKAIFEFANYSVQTVESGRGCFEALKEGSFDVVILDIQLGDMNGLEVLREIKRLQPKLPVIIMSVYYDQNIQTQQIIAEEADGCIKKPFEIEEAISTVEKVVRLNIDD